MKRILHVIDTGGPGGAETVFFDLIRGLDRSRWQSVAAVPDTGWIYRKMQEIGVEVHVVRSFGSFSRGYLSDLSQLVERYDVDLVHAHLLGPSVYASAIRALHGVPVVSTLHGAIDGDAQHAHRGAKFRILSLGASRVVLVSDPLREVFLDQAPLRRSRTAVIENGIDLQEFAPRRSSGLRHALGFDDSHFLVGAVGNIRPTKRYDTFLEAAARLVARSDRYRFVVYGHWHDRLDPALVELQHRLGLDDHVRFAGYTPDVASALNGLDAFLLTSESEGFSLATIQAMACELPVVATRCGGPESIVTDGVHGLLVEVGAVDRIADAVERLRLDPELRRTMGRAGRALAESRFSVASQVGRYERLYEEVLRSSLTFPLIPGGRWLARRLATSAA